MRVQATKTMAKAIQQYCKTDERFNGYQITTEDMTDYFVGTNTYIKVIYPYDYYALPNYLSTRDLTKIYNRSDKTYDGFMKAVLEEIEV
jgi:hypothetical protein